jgi:hypothetical protein
MSGISRADCSLYLRYRKSAKMFNFGRPKSATDWVVHFIGALIALFLIWWLLRLFLGI